MKVGVVRFPETTGHPEAAWACRSLGWEPVDLGPETRALPEDLDLLLLPGGDPDDDALKAQVQSPLGRLIPLQAERGRRVLGLGAGFAFLCACDLLPGQLAWNPGDRLLHGPVRFRLERPLSGPTPWPAGQLLELPVATRRGTYTLEDEAHVDLELSGAVLLRACGPQGEIGEAWNPTGSRNGVAGVQEASGRILGVLPQLERAVGGPGSLALLAALGANPCPIVT